MNQETDLGHLLVVIGDIAIGIEIGMELCSRDKDCRDRDCRNRGRDKQSDHRKAKFQVLKVC